MDTREIAINAIRRMPAGIDYDDIVKMLGDELYRIECEAFGIEAEQVDDSRHEAIHPANAPSGKKLSHVELSPGVCELMKPGEIWDAFFPYGGSLGRKRRPVLVLTNPHGPVPELIVAYITGAALSPLLTTDICLDPILPQFTATGLSRPSTMRLHKLATLHSLDFKSFRGVVDNATWLEVQVQLRTIFNL